MYSGNEAQACGIYAAFFSAASAGRELEFLGDFVAARLSYEQAAHDYTEAQSPFIALSQLALRSGQKVEASKTIARLFRLAEQPGDHDDPWWSYATAAGRTADAKFADMRKAFREAQ